MGVATPSQSPTGGVGGQQPMARVGSGACICSFVEYVLYVCRVPGHSTHRYLQCALVSINGSPLFRNIL